MSAKPPPPAAADAASSTEIRLRSSATSFESWRDLTELWASIGNASEPHLSADNPHTIPIQFRPLLAVRAPVENILTTDTARQMFWHPEEEDGSSSDCVPWLGQETSKEEKPGGVQ